MREQLRHKMREMVATLGKGEALHGFRGKEKKYGYAGTAA